MGRVLCFERRAMRFAIFIVSLWAFFVFGWIWNIVKLVNSGFDVINGMLIARAIGIFVAPLGSVLGYL